MWVVSGSSSTEARSASRNAAAPIGVDQRELGAWACLAASRQEREQATSKRSVKREVCGCPSASDQTTRPSRVNQAAAQFGLSQLRKASGSANRYCASPMPSVSTTYMPTRTSVDRAARE